MISSNLLAEFQGREMTNSLDYCPKARTEEILAHDVGDEVVIYDLKDDKAYCLNRVAAKVWKHCDGKTPVSELAGLLGELGLPAEPVGVQCVLDQLNDSRLLERVEIEENKNSKPVKQLKEAQLVTRRAALVKLGVAAAVVLTSVNAMNAPLASQAQSGGPTG